MTNQHDGELLQLLTETQSIMGRLFAHRAKDLGLTRPQWRVIGRLNRHNGMTQAALSELTGIAPSPLGKVVDQLEAKGYIERRNDPDDRRVNRLHLTDAVQPLVAPAQRLVTDLERAALERLPSNANLVEQLTQLRTSLIEIAEREFAPS
jgi:MarR family transcriptional regulator, transcriptional regulator for hemolysin